MSWRLVLLLLIASMFMIWSLSLMLYLILASEIQNPEPGNQWLSEFPTLWIRERNVHAFAGHGTSSGHFTVTTTSLSEKLPHNYVIDYFSLTQWRMPPKEIWGLFLTRRFRTGFIVWLLWWTEVLSTSLKETFPRNWCIFVLCWLKEVRNRI